MTTRPLDSERLECPGGTCAPSRSGRFCLACGRSIGGTTPPPDVIDEALALARAAGDDLDPDNPNYWVYLMHGAEIIDASEARRLNGGLAFYGSARKRSGVARD
jgi:hypothetical protein